MKSKLTELAESSPSAPPPSVLHGSGILSRFSSPSMDSSGQFDPTQIYDGYKQRDVARWTNVGGPIPVSGRPIYSSSEVPISGINTEGIVKRIRQIANSPHNLDAEGSDELDVQESEVIPHSADHPSNSSPSQPPAKRFQSEVSPSTPRDFQPTIATIPTSIPPASPHSSHTRPALNPEVRPSPIQKSINSPLVSSNLWPVQVEEEKNFLHCRFLPPKCFSAGIDGLSKLPEKTQIWQVIIRMLWPGYLGGLIEIVGR
ncbi:hypothetical protein O181_084399 [Austropuccinia psidii MF-1]|uniref:Uncharacterized protein n=1 Tax=Austropuccinia psidii MF-1 TaxID=1389203 RepID=A0A9Q3FTD8_9BASI|nr:hypothetical protein [Austropuccinia psidii MF-1]